LRLQLETIEKILNKSAEMFMRYGVRSVSMDDISRELGMSKKTLYQFAANKEDLINMTLENHFAQEKQFCTNVLEGTEHAIEEMLLLAKHLIETMRDTNHAVLFELKKYYPEAFKMVEDYRNTFIYNNILSNIKKGIRQGLYRKDFKPELIARFYTAKFELLFNPAFDTFKEFSISDINRESIIYHIRGIASEKGLEYLNENLKKIK
jgi:TetR/AcrR family transcriptional regulator, cholesterol catabolism regulator